VPNPEDISHSIVVRCQVPGFHHWENPHPARRYLADRHRHLFHVEVEMTVAHDDREVEYHDLLDHCRVWFPGGEMGPMSCEQMATRLARDIASVYPGRQLVVSIFEDGEAGSRVRLG